MLKAAEDWEALGEPKRAAECRAIHAFRTGDYEEAARGYAAAGQPEMAVTSRVFAAQVTMDYEAAERAVEESGLPDMRKALIGDREIWLAQARRAGRGACSGRGPRGPEAEALDPALSGRDSPPPGRSCEHRVRDPRGGRSRRARRRHPGRRGTHPGLTCERIAEVVLSPTALVKPPLAALTASGRLRKVGRARGTRYHLA